MASTKDELAESNEPRLQLQYSVRIYFMYHSERACELERMQRNVEAVPVNMFGKSSYQVPVVLEYSCIM